MAELDDPQPAHREIAEHAAELGIELIAVGTDLYGIAPVDDARRGASARSRRGRRAREGQPGRRSAGVAARLVAAG